MPPSPTDAVSLPGLSRTDATRLSVLTARLAAPEDYFAGITLRSGLTPDNILFFTRTNTEAFRPDDASSNTHHRFELLIIIRKEGPAHIGETSYLLQPGDAALIFPHQFHHYMDVEPGAIEWLFITFELADETSLASLRNSPRRLGPDELRLLENILHERSCLEERQASAPLAISHGLSQLLLRLLEASPLPAERVRTNQANSARDTLLEKISRYVHSHLSDRMTLDTISSALGYSESHLRTLFRNQLGLSLGRYIRESRLIEATRLLQAGETNIAEVARKSGFESPFAFSRAFKKAYGVPPKSYSKRIQNQSNSHSL